MSSFPEQQIKQQKRLTFPSEFRSSHSVQKLCPLIAQATAYIPHFTDQIPGVMHSAAHALSIISFNPHSRPGKQVQHSCSFCRCLNQTSERTGISHSRFHLEETENSGLHSGCVRSTCRSAPARSSCLLPHRPDSSSCLTQDSWMLSWGFRSRE